MNSSSCVVVFSGGQDSTTCLYLAKSTYSRVMAISFDYGQRHIIELSQASKIAKSLDIPHKIISLDGILENSSLIDRSLSEEKHQLDGTLPATFVPGRNILFLNIAAIFAINNGISDVMLGICQVDYSGYPDCTEDFRSSMEQTLSIGIGQPICIHAPLIDKSKAEIWKLAKDGGFLDVIINDTITDYRGDTTKNEWGMGSLDNEASRLRAKGYFEAKDRGWL